MSSARVEPELHALRKLAEQLAHGRREVVTSAHLLAAIAARPSAASMLLEERRLTSDDILRYGRTLSDDVEQAIPQALARAHQVAVRMGATKASSDHLLVALLSEPRAAARRLLEQFGTDVSRLRTAALQVGLGLVARRIPSARGNAVVASACGARTCSSASASHLDCDCSADHVAAEAGAGGRSGAGACGPGRACRAARCFSLRRRREGRSSSAEHRAVRARSAALSGADVTREEPDSRRGQG